MLRRKDAQELSSTWLGRNKRSICISSGACVLLETCHAKPSTYCTMVSHSLKSSVLSVSHSRSRSAALLGPNMKARFKLIRP